MRKCKWVLNWIKDHTCLQIVLSFSFWRQKLEAAFSSIQDLVEEVIFKELCEDEITVGGWGILSYDIVLEWTLGWLDDF